MRARILLAGLLLVVACTKKSDTEPQADVATVTTPSEWIQAVAADIEKLAGDYPQLADFDASEHADVESLTISYGYHTHQPQGRAGWAGAVPNPDPDGVWFHIDLHDPASTRQIHTQPVVEDLRYGELKVMFLILEGEDAKPVSGALHALLDRHGAHPPE